MSCLDGARLPARIAVLGCNGYLGSRLVAALLRTPGVERVLGVGRQSRPAVSGARLVYRNGDLRKAPIARWLADERIEALVHVAFISRPMRDEEEALSINVGAAEQVFAAAGEAGIAHAILVSSVAVYGPHDGAAPWTENDPASPNAFQFARHKLLQEQAAAEAAQGRYLLTITRPCTVVGADVRNFLLDYLRRGVVALPTGRDPAWQFLHEDDHSAATVELLSRRVAGTFNLVPDDVVGLREAVGLLGGRWIALPASLLSAAITVGWWAGIGAIPGPASAFEFLLHPPTASNERLRRTLGFRFRFTSRNALAAINATVGERVHG